MPHFRFKQIPFLHFIDTANVMLRGNDARRFLGREKRDEDPTEEPEEVREEYMYGR